MFFCAFALCSDAFPESDQWLTDSQLQDLVRAFQSPSSLQPPIIAVLRDSLACMYKG